MWTSIWSSTVSQTRDSDIYCDFLPYSGLLPYFCPMDIHGKVAHIHWPGPSDFSRSRQVHGLACSCTLCLCNSSASHSLLPDAEPHHADAHELLCHPLHPCATLLVSCVQVRAGQPRCCTGHQCFILVECGFLGGVHEVLSFLCENLCAGFHGAVSRDQRVLLLCCALCIDGLVSRLLVLDPVCCFFLQKCSLKVS